MKLKKSTTSGISNIYIDQILKPYHLPHFIGIFPSDKCPKLDKIPKNFCMILNTDTSSGPGKHWFCVMRHNKEIKISDSSNILLPLINPPNNLADIVRKGSLLRTYPIQPVDTKTCGFYCIHDVLLYHLKLLKKKSKTKPFKRKHTTLNDEICISNIEKMMPIIN